MFQIKIAKNLICSYMSSLSIFVSFGRVSNLKYESVHIDFKTVVFIRVNPGKKETIDGSGSHVNFIQKRCSFPEVVSPEKWYVPISSHGSSYPPKNLPSQT